MSLKIEELFSHSRFPGGIRFILCLLYFPAGILLSLLRLFITLHALIVASILPKPLFLRRWVLRCLCTVLGVFVVEKDESRDSQSHSGPESVLVANHISILDHLVVDILRPNFVLTNKKLSGFLQWFHGYYSVYEDTSVRRSVMIYSRAVSVQLLTFPEEALTSSGRGLLKFSPFTFELDLPLQPVLISARRPLISISLNVLGAQSWQDGFWHLFSPMTVYTVRFLPIQRRAQSESVADFSTRVRLLMSQSLNLETTCYTSTDKIELVKRLSFDQSGGYQSGPVPSTFSSHPSRHPHTSRRPSDDRLTLMVRQVKDVLPDVPFEVIKRDLRTSNNVDITITNILEGITCYTPESSPGSSLSSQNQPSSHTVTPVTPVTVTTFSRSPRERHQSLAQRKQQLVQEARVRYLERQSSSSTST